MQANFLNAAHFLATLIIAVLLTACQPKPPALTEQEKQHMKTLTANMTPRCFGRYLVDMPQDFVLNTEGGQRIDGVTINVKPMQESQFKLLLANKRAELESSFLPGKEKYPFARSMLPVPDAKNGLIIDRAKSLSSSSRMGRTLEVLAWKDGYRIHASIDAIDTNFPEYANDTWIKKSKTTTSEKLAQLLAVFNRTRGKADHEIPAEKGVCILNGFVSGASTNQEMVALIYHLKQVDDVYFRFETDSYYAVNDTLLDRVKRIEPLIRAEKGEKLLRTGSREDNGIHAEEILYTEVGEDNLAGNNQAMTHQYHFEGNAKIGSAKTPRILINFANGVRKPEPDRAVDDDFPPPITRASLSDAEAMALWDTIIPTIRPRPGAF